MPCLGEWSLVFENTRTDNYGNVMSQTGVVYSYQLVFYGTDRQPVALLGRSAHPPPERHPSGTQPGTQAGTQPAGALTREALEEMFPPWVIRSFDAYKMLHSWNVCPSSVCRAKAL